MKKLFISSLLLFMSLFAFGQSVLIEPAVTNKDFALKTTGAVYGNFSTTSIGGADLIFRRSTTGDGTSGPRVGRIATYPDRFSLIGGTSYSLGLGADGIEYMRIATDGKVGIGNQSPDAKLHINHLATTASPTIHLENTSGTSSYIKTTSTSPGSWENHFINNALPATSLVYWRNSINDAFPLVLSGDGDAFIGRNAEVKGFTKLGEEATSPKIKMKKLTGTTNATAGGVANIPHGIGSAAKILSIDIAVNASSSTFVPENYTQSINLEFNYYYNDTNIDVVTKAGNSAIILGRPIKIIITYEE